MSAMRAIWVGVAGFFGAVSRYSLGLAITRVNRTEFPWGTLAINISGSFLLGFTFALMTERFHANPTLRIALTVGFLGAYTTFSTFTFETLEMIERGAIATAVGYILASVVPGIVAVWLGARLAG